MKNLMFLFLLLAGSHTYASLEPTKPDDPERFGAICSPLVLESISDAQRELNIRLNAEPRRFRILKPFSIENMVRIEGRYYRACAELEFYDKFNP